MKKKSASCEHKRTQFYSLNERSENGKLKESSMALKCLDCEKIFSITYTPADKEAVKQKFGNATLENIRVFLSSKKREPIKELAARLGKSERSTYEATEPAREAERKAIQKAVDFFYNAEGLTQAEIAKRIEKSQSTVSDILKKVRKAREKA